MTSPRQFDLQRVLGDLRGRAVLLQRQFDERAMRERLMIIAGVLAIVAWAADTLLLSPAFAHWKEQHQQVRGLQQAAVQVRQDRAEREVQARALQQQLLQDLSTWRRRVQESDQNMRQTGGELVPAGDMVAVLKGVLEQTGGLKLRSLQSVPRTEIAGPSAAASAASAAALAAPDVGRLYRQGVDLEVEGSYDALLSYCQALEALPQHMLWGGMHLKADRHPHLVLTLRLYTLSPDRNWLVI
jgi:MSHA biogenesis protein MshJ